MAWSGHQRGQCMKALTGHAAWPLIRKADDGERTADGHRQTETFQLEERALLAALGQVSPDECRPEDRFADVIDDVGGRLFVRATSADQADSEVPRVCFAAA
jgi:hypothetical protein